MYLYIFCISLHFMIFFRAVLAHAMEFRGSFWWWAKAQKLRNRGWEWEVSPTFQHPFSSLLWGFATLLTLFFQVVGTTAEEHPCPIANTLAWSNLSWSTTSSRFLYCICIYIVIVFVFLVFVYLPNCKLTSMVQPEVVNHFQQVHSHAYFENLYICTFYVHIFVYLYIYMFIYLYICIFICSYICICIWGG